MADFLGLDNPLFAENNWGRSAVRFAITPPNTAVWLW